MIINAVSSNMFSVELEPEEFVHLVHISNEDPKQMLEVVQLWCEIGYQASLHLTQKTEMLCRLSKLRNANSS